MTKKLFMMMAVLAMMFSFSGLAVAGEVAPPPLSTSEMPLAVPGGSAGLPPWDTSKVREVGLSPDVKSPEITGTTVTFSAGVLGNLTPLFQFWVQDPAGNWTSSGSYSTANKFLLTGTMPGTYTIIVYAKPFAVENWQAYKEVKFTFADDVQKVRSVGLSADMSSPQPVWGPVTFTATSTGSDNPIYTFSLRSSDCTDPGDWYAYHNSPPSNNVFQPKNWNILPGTYTVRVEAKDVNSEYLWEAYDEMTFTFSPSDGYTDGFVFNPETGTITKYVGPGGDVVIPDKIGGVDVVEIGDQAFQGCSSIAEITIPNSVTLIGQYAFSSCTSLTEIIIPDSVESIGGGAFASCANLAEITLPDSVTAIRGHFFDNCTSLAEIIIPDGVTRIGYAAFYRCTGLTEIVIPDGVESIEDYAFLDCTSLTKITIPDSVKSIGDGAFRGCTNLEEPDYTFPIIK